MASSPPEQQLSEKQIAFVENTFTASDTSKEDLIREKEDFISALERERDGPTVDFEIVCASNSFNVHRLVIGMHSQYFKRLCEGAFVESEHRRVVLHGDSVAAVKAMIDYAYTFNYLDPVIYPKAGTIDSPDAEPRSTLEAHAQIFTLGDKYGMKRLANLAMTKFGKHLLDSVPLEKDRADPKTYFSRMADELIPATQYIYNNTPAGDGRLRKVAAGFWALPDSLLVHANRGDFDVLLAEVPEFGRDLVEEMGDVVIGNQRQRIVRTLHTTAIVNGEDTLKVYRLVLSLHSEYFKHLFESSFKEATERNVILHDDLPLTVKAIVRCFCEFDHNHANPNAEDRAIFDIANKYDIPGLKDKILESFEIDFNDTDKPAWLEAANVIPATAHIYQNTPPDDDRLRKRLVECFKARDWMTLKYGKKAEFDELLVDVPEFAADLIASATGTGVGEWYDGDDESMNRET